MGVSGMSYGSWMVIACVALVMFGPQKMKQMSKDLGEAIAAFREGLSRTHSND
ncbi:MAG: twin-arginine translocase TatA/TatE family subunit [Gammaproteobacteria bacterium]|nr:twin-arginine translocase TatA/TatE family subunit [Gammaproteobacteria bacterium]